ncbi:cytochrome P450 [Streptomyces sp. NBC_01304]|uniref:cytochrome P450 n=1 Tax=Streptomyces sp. NBC_01304 TaxID=2903818 RepID=UPI002E14441A|nr:cytochrome P450 [Streptomyces sp. NBC_01304]
MIEDAPERTCPATPPVREWPAQDLTGTDFDPVLTELMEQGPMHRIQLPHGEGWAWLATRYDDVRMITNDPRFTRHEITERQITRLAPHFKPKPGSLAFADGSDHHRLRRVVAPAFTAAGVERFRGRAQEVLDGLMDALLAEGPPADLTTRVLGPFPVEVVCEVMGVPVADRPQLKEWTDQIVFPSQDAQTTGQVKDRLYGWLGEAIRARRGSTGEDILSLLGAGVARGDLSEDEAVGVAGPLQIGGEAVTNNVGQMLYLLLTRPQLLERLTAEPELRPRALDELLRYIPHRSAVGLARIATEDVDLRGHRITAGDPVYVSYLAANRDPEVFPDPEHIDFDRAPNPHVSFGYGTHYCVGGLLARLEIDLLMDAVLDRLPGLRLAVPAEQVPWRRRALIRGPQALQVGWESGV